MAGGCERSWDRASVKRAHRRLVNKRGACTAPSAIESPLTTPLTQPHTTTATSCDAIVDKRFAPRSDLSADLVLRNRYADWCAPRDVARPACARPAAAVSRQRGDAKAALRRGAGRCRGRARPRAGAAAWSARRRELAAACPGSPPQPHRTTTMMACGPGPVGQPASLLSVGTSRAAVMSTSMRSVRGRSAVRSSLGRAILCVGRHAAPGRLAPATVSTASETRPGESEQGRRLDVPLGGSPRSTSSATTRKR
jgi:hypothetical protein